MQDTVTITDLPSHVKSLEALDDLFGNSHQNMASL